MPGKGRPFVKGDPRAGRPKGLPNYATREIKAWAENFLSSPEYVASAEKRVKQGKAPHLEVLWHHYAYGKPKETIHHEGKVPAFILKLDDGHDQ